MIISFFKFNPKKTNVKKNHFAILEKEWFFGVAPPPQIM